MVDSPKTNEQLSNDATSAAEQLTKTLSRVQVALCQTASAVVQVAKLQRRDAVGSLLSARGNIRIAADHLVDAWAKLRDPGQPKQPERLAVDKLIAELFEKATFPEGYNQFRARREFSEALDRYDLAVETRLAPVQDTDRTCRRRNDSRGCAPECRATFNQPGTGCVASSNDPARDADR